MKTSQEKQLNNNDNLYLWDKSVNLKALFELLTQMHRHQIALDEDALKKLYEAGFTNPVNLANYCFKSGWNEAVKVVIQTITDKIKDDTL